ncbi:5476_t:CDS:2, partial [Racocetra fulgida]
MYVEAEIFCDGPYAALDWPKDKEPEHCLHIDNRYTYLNLTVSAPKNPQAIGKLEFKDDNGDREYFFYEPLWVNEQ